MTSPDATLPRVSAIIAAHNAGAFIGQAVSSALASRGVRLEVIVVDDESTDDTWEILEGFGEKVRRVRQLRGGPYKARNLGASLAHGEWLAFLDADDDWAPDKLVKQLALAEGQVGLIYTDRLNFGDLGRIKVRQSDSVTLHEGDVFEPLLLGNFITLSSVMLRKDWFDRLGGFSEARQGVQDWDLWLRYAAHGGTVALCREPLTRYRLHESQMSNAVEARAREREAVIRRALKSPRGRRVLRAVARRALSNSWEIAAWQSEIAQRWGALRWYLRSALYWPWNVRLYKGMIKCLLGVG
jgi:glycosyltransferase involved in cell wall biosynthesis